MTLKGVPQLLDASTRAIRPEVIGRVTRISGLTIEAVGIEAPIGELCVVRGSAGDIPAEVIGFGKNSAVLMPIGEAHGIAPRDPVVASGRPLLVRVSLDCLGRVLDGLGRPLDGGPELTGEEMPITAAPPAALERVPIVDPIETGVAAIDGFLTCGRGQRLGIFSGSGVGKSTLLGMIAKNSNADINVVALVGERGREVKEFIEETLGREGMAKSVLVVATSDASPLLRFKATFTAVAVAEYFRDAGKRVLLVMDSVTRFAAAAREIGLAAGEPPTLRGYPPSLFAQLPKVVERLGVTKRGSITGLFTVLVEGDDLNEPVSDTMRGLLDGHVILDRAVAARGNFPAIQVLDSVSRLMPRLVSPEQLESARELRAMLAIYEESRELIQVGAYQAGTDERLDRAIAAMPAIERILFHTTARRRAEETWPSIMEVAGGVSPLVAPGGVQNRQSPSG